MYWDYIYRIPSKIKYAVFGGLEVFYKFHGFSALYILIKIGTFLSVLLIDRIIKCLLLPIAVFNLMLTSYLIWILTDGFIDKPVLKLLKPIINFIWKPATRKKLADDFHYCVYSLSGEPYRIQSRPTNGQVNPDAQDDIRGDINPDLLNEPLGGTRPQQ